MPQRAVPLALLLAACGPSTPVDDTDTDVVDETDDTEAGLDDTAADDTGEVAPPPGVTFVEGRWKVESLRILQAGRGIDLDGDGDNDNQIATVLNLVDTTFGSSFGGMSVDDVNSRIDDMLLAETVIVLLEGRYDGSKMTVDVVQGERDWESGTLYATADSYDGSGVAVEKLDGRFTDSDTFSLGPDPLTLPIQLYPNEPVLRIAATDARFVADLTTGGVDGNIAGAFTIDALMDGLIDPMLEAYFGDDPAQADDYRGLLRSLLEIQADLTIEDEPALSGAFGFDALESPWEDPRE